jgi:hypothetical protein
MEVSMSRSFDAALLAFFALFPLSSLAAVIDLPSAWLATPPAAPGGRVAWEGIVLPLGDTPLSAAVRNDADSLFVRVRTSDPDAVRRIRMTGLTVWVDRAGKSRRGYGVRFPLGGPRGMGGGMPPGEGGGGFARGERPEGAPARGASPDPAVIAAEMELIGPGEDDRLTVPAVGGGGAWARLEEASNVLTLEFRFPLLATDEHPLAVGAAPGGTIAIGFETEKPRRPEGGDGRPEGGPPGGMHGGGGPGGGMGGPGGGMGGPGGGMGGPGMRPPGGGMRGPEGAMPKAMKVWTRVTLATAPKEGGSVDVPGQARLRRSWQMTS